MPETQTTPDDVDKTQLPGLGPRLLLIAAVMLVVGVFVIVAVSQFATINVRMAALALVVCVVSTQLAHVVGAYPSGNDYFMARLGGSMFARTCLPFLVVVLAKLSDRIPFEPGFVFFVILFYLVGLIVDVLLQVRQYRSTP